MEQLEQMLNLILHESIEAIKDMENDDKHLLKERLELIQELANELLVSQNLQRYEDDGFLLSKAYANL
ncbi:hypothetical protein QO009_003032 [Brevibacillus aydinogluensis]|jgi:hypothetical protein|uniref:hypothetical protein n=1 Tax=Brevibacillus aydinogluensis TaxID=927786 RepID=UPI002892B1D2|nr:hypothetical protein [Brevibacillus aydinogluensis]MDT3417137.1 hypothetical protein [Brevibacillus aydinogluensis]